MNLVSMTQQSPDNTATLLSPESPELLRQMAVSVLQVTGAQWTCITRRLPDGTGFEVMAGAGAGAPPAGRGLPLVAARPPGGLVLPLVLGGDELGSIVVGGMTWAADPASRRELALLGTAAALALRNLGLVDSLDREAVTAAQRQFRLLSGTIYHLKTALANSTEYLDLLKFDSELSPGQREYVARSRRRLDVAMRLLSELHDLGMTDAGELELEGEPLHVAAVIRELVQEHRAAATAATAAIALELPELPLLHMDGDCLRQILDTLVHNAVRYSPPGGVVRVWAELLRDGAGTPELLVYVTDAGPGVAEQNGVFEELQRVERKGQPGFRLAIARRLARLMDGELELVTGGDGATFLLRLPAPLA